MSGLWEHQVAALDTLRTHLANANAGKDADEGAALVSMPTGTGKSAVIAQLLADPGVGAASKGPAIVLVPWRGLAHQLAEDIDSRVWSNMGVPRPDALPPVAQVRSASTFCKTIRDRSTPTQVYVTTMAMAVEIWRTLEHDLDAMKNLFAGFSSVIVDESHYEPAPSWSTAVRSMSRPTCLLTATPFRNDNRYFQINADATFRYSHAQAEADGVLRTPAFEKILWSGSEAAFVEALLKRLRRRDVRRSDRVIVRCEKGTEVAAITRILRRNGHAAAGFHETFTVEAEAGLYRSVPPPSDRMDVRFWVHQNKLTEGFDDPGARVLAVYGGFGNDRSRVQQVGRILRNPGRMAGAQALVVSADAAMADAWHRYTTFDSQDSTRSVATDPVGVEELLGAQPETFYWDRRFRSRFDIVSDQAWKDIKYRLSTAIRVADCAIDLDATLEEVLTDLKADDLRIVSVASPSGNARVVIFLEVQNSPILRSGAFVEMTLGYLVLYIDEEQRLFVSGTVGVPKSIRDTTHPLDARSLQKLLPSGARISEVSLANNHLGPRTIRGRSLSADDLGEIASEMGDSTFAFSTAQGHLEIGDEKVMRYAGVRNARLTDRRNSERTFPDLVAWFNEIRLAIAGSGASAKALTRYSAPEPPPCDPKAEHVLLDIDPADFENPETGAAPTIDDFGGRVEAGAFEVRIDGETIPVAIGWNAALRRFDLSSTVNLPYRGREGSRQCIFQEIARGRAVRVALDDGLVYTNGNFWNLGPRSRADSSGLLSLLETKSELAMVLGEKGDVVNDKWDNTSAFGVIDNLLLPPVLDGSQTVLCTDMGWEIADFIACDSQKVVFVHAKSKTISGDTKPSKISASNLHEVVSQALKNLKFATIGNTDKPNYKTWTKPWTDGSHSGTATRLRRGDPSKKADTYWQRVDSVVQTHSAVREVWLVLGASLSKDALEAELKKSTPNAPAVQVHALLTSAWSAAQQCGVRLRVYCSP